MSIEIFGRKLKIVSDSSRTTCNKCALNDICELIHFELDTAPCEKANGEYNQHFEYQIK